jgi:hypothetical protein
LNIRRFQIGEISQNLNRINILGQHFQNVGHPNPHSPNAGFTTAQSRRLGDSLEKLLIHHGAIAPEWSTSSILARIKQHVGSN